MACILLGNRDTQNKTTSSLLGKKTQTVSGKVHSYDQYYATCPCTILCISTHTSSYMPWHPDTHILLYTMTSRHTHPLICHDISTHTSSYMPWHPDTHTLLYAMTSRSYSMPETWDCSLRAARLIRQTSIIIGKVHYKMHLIGTQRIMFASSNRLYRAFYCNNID